AECVALPVEPEPVRPLRLLPEPELLSRVVASAQPAVVQLPSAPAPPSTRLASPVYRFPRIASHAGRPTRAAAPTALARPCSACLVRGIEQRSLRHPPGANQQRSVADSVGGCVRRHRVNRRMAAIRR